MDAVKIVTSFGPIAFGTVVLVVLWKVIVKPELDARRMEAKAFETQLTALTKLNDQISRTAQLQESNTQALTALVEAQRALLADFRGLLQTPRGG